MTQPVPQLLPPSRLWGELDLTEAPTLLDGTWFIRRESIRKPEKVLELVWPQHGIAFTADIYVRLSASEDLQEPSLDYQDFAAEVVVTYNEDGIRAYWGLNNQSLSKIRDHGIRIRSGGVVFGMFPFLKGKDLVIS